MGEVVVEVVEAEVEAEEDRIGRQMLNRLEKLGLNDGCNLSWLIESSVISMFDVTSSVETVMPCVAKRGFAHLLIFLNPLERSWRNSSDKNE